MSKPIAILYANLKSNLGDFAILHAMLLQIANKYPAHPIHVYPHDWLPVDEARLSAFKASGVPHFELMNLNHSNRFPEMLKGFRQIGLGPFMHGLFVKRLTTQIKDKFAFFADYESIFICGGAQWGAVVGDPMFAAVNAASYYNSAIFSFPFSIESKVASLHSRKNLNNYFSKIVAPIAVRDSASKRIIDKIGVPCVLSSDSVFSLRHLASKIAPREVPQKNKIILSVTKDLDALYGDLRLLIPNLLINYNVELLTTCTIVEGRMYRKLSEEFLIPFHEPLTWQETVAHYKSCGVLITNRLHGVILGMLAEAIVLPIVNRSKTKHVVNDVNFNIFVNDVKSIDLSQIEKVEENGASNKSVTNKYMENLSVFHI